MKKIMIHGIFILLLLSIPLLFCTFNNNFQNDQKTTINSSKILTVSGTNVTSPSDLAVLYDDPINNTISWNLTDSGSLDYLGLYSFTTDTVGGNPTGWPTVEGPSTSLQVIQEWTGHNKVVDIYDNNGASYSDMSNSFAARSTGTVEFWVYGQPAVAGQNSIQISLKSGGYSGTNGPGINIDYKMQKFQYVVGASVYNLTDFSKDQWHHIRIAFNSASDTYDVWLDQNFVGNDLGYQFVTGNMDLLVFYSGTAPSGGFHTYVDAIDYSWASGYYLNRNINGTPVYIDYLGLYSFTTDTVGGNPTGWPTVEGPSTSLQVIQEWAGHNKVVDIYDNNAGDYSDMSNSFAARSTGTVEFWVYGQPAVTGQNSIQIILKSGGYSGTDGPGINIDYKMQKFQYVVGASVYNLTDFSKDQWHHIRIAFDSTADTYDVWLDQTFVGNDLAYQFVTGNIDLFTFYSGTAPTGGFHTYVDAIDYSWAPGYYLNRNVNNPNLNYAIFDDGTVKMTWTQWSDQVNVAYNVSGLSLGVGIHNISLVFNDRTGKWFHDDVIVTVIDPDLPQILDVVQNPGSPGYQEPVIVTAHITDNIEIQEVFIEANYTGGTGSGDYLALYSFTNDTVGGNPTGWPTVEGPSTSLQVIQEWTGHNKVVDLYDNNAGSYSDMSNSFAARATGTVEFWVYGQPAVAGQNSIQIILKSGGYSGTDGPGINVDYKMQKFQYVTGGSLYNLTDFSKDQWHHIRIAFNSTSDTYDVWLDQTFVGNDLAYQFVTGNIDLFTFYSGTAPSGAFHTYIDAVDYSWAPGYFLNRNLPPTGFINSSMSLLSGNQSDGLWTYTFNNYPTNKSIFYRILAQDTFGNWNATNYNSFGYFDTLGPNIIGVTQEPSEPPYLALVNVTVRVTDATQVQAVSIQTNYTGTFSSYPLSLISGTSQDGIWKFSFGNYPVNETISYRIITQDILGNQNNTNYNGFGYFDTLGPNIIGVTQEPSEPPYLALVNVTVRVTDATQVQAVSIQTNYTGMFSSYPLSLISGTSQDGIWKFSFGNYPVNETISYRIITSDVLGNQNTTGYYGFGYFDFLAPDIISIIQVPSTPTYLDIVNVTVHITDATLVQTVSIQTNYTGTLSTYPMMLTSGSPSDGVWKYVFNTYPLNALIIYSISTQDIFGNSNTSTQSSFGVFDLIDPAILNVVQTPATLTRWDSVQVIAHVQENFALGSVMINSNHTASWANYPMVLLNGSLQDGFWGFTITNYPYNKSIWYRVSAIDVVGRTTTTGYSHFGIFPIVSNHVPLDLEIDVDVGMAGNRKADITFTFQNTGNTNLVNINFTIHLPIGWTANTLVRSVGQLAPGQTVTITFKITVPSNVSEFLELVLIDVDARISELGMDWPTQSIEVVVSGVKVWDLFIWLIVIVGSCSAGVATTYVYIHKRSVGQKVLSTKVKGKTTIAITNALSTDIPGQLSAISMEVMDKIENLPGITNDEKLLIIQYISQLDEEDAIKYLDEMKNTQMD